MTSRFSLALLAALFATGVYAQLHAHVWVCTSQAIDGKMARVCTCTVGGETVIR